MKISSKYKRFKHSYFSSNTFTLPKVRSSIIRMIRRYIHYQNTTNLKRLEKEPQIKEIQQQKTVKILSISDRTFWSNLHLKNEIMLSWLSSMFVHGYQYPNVYINIKKLVLMNKDIQ